MISLSFNPCIAPRDRQRIKYDTVGSIILTVYPVHMASRIGTKPELKGSVYKRGIKRNMRLDAEDQRYGKRLQTWKEEEMIIYDGECNIHMCSRLDKGK